MIGNILFILLPSQPMMTSLMLVVGIWSALISILGGLPSVQATVDLKGLFSTILGNELEDVPDKSPNYSHLYGQEHEHKKWNDKKTNEKTLGSQNQNFMGPEATFTEVRYSSLFF